MSMSSTTAATITVTAVPTMQQSDGCVKVATFKGTAILLHWSFFAAIGFFLIRGFISLYPYRTMLYWLLFYGPCMFISIFLRELGKIIVTKKLGGEVTEAILWPLGSLSFYGPPDKGVMGDLKIALSGPLFQVPFMVIMAMMYIFLKTDQMSPLTSIFVSYNDIINGIGELFLALCLETFWYNTLVISLNLLIPIYPLDAIRIWTAVLRQCGKGLDNTAKIISYSGIFISASLLIFGIVEILFYRVFGLGAFEVTAGVSGLVSSKYLNDKIKAGVLNADPVFGRACYKTSQNSNFEMNGNTKNGSEIMSIDSNHSFPIENTEGIV